MAAWICADGDEEVFVVPSKWLIASQIIWAHTCSYPDAHKYRQADGRGGHFSLKEGLLFLQQEKINLQKQWSKVFPFSKTDARSKPWFPTFDLLSRFLGACDRMAVMGRTTLEFPSAIAQESRHCCVCMKPLAPGVHHIFECSQYLLCSWYNIFHQGQLNKVIRSLHRDAARSNTWCQLTGWRFSVYHGTSTVRKNRTGSGLYTGVYDQNQEGQGSFLQTGASEHLRC